MSRQAQGSIHRYSYRDFHHRVRRLGSALKHLDVRAGERVATFCWNHYRHLELYFAVPCFGAVLHTVNIRLSDDDLIYIFNHAEDTVIFVDDELVPVIERILPSLTAVRHIVIMGEEAVPNLSKRSLSYEELIQHGDESFAFGELDENLPSGMCYTSATTGKPKGVIYTQRAIYLHAMTLCLADVMAISEHDTVMPVVPMYHVNSWGLPFASIFAGANLVLPGPRPQARDLLRLIASEHVSFAAAAVTVGIDMLRELESEPEDISSLRQLMLGGQATPKAVMEKYLSQYGIPIFTAWGATETSPIATAVHIKKHERSLDDHAKIDIRVRQGVVVPGLELKVVNEQGEGVSWDDRQMGEIWVRGPWVATEYYRDSRSAEGFADGWWKSGDMATINEEGVLRLVDRAKDLIKSGGEWISSVQLENELMAHPAIVEACVVAVPHEKWIERPVAFVVSRDIASFRDEELEHWLTRKFPKWWVPDQFIRVDQIPRTGAGKFNKRELRERLRTLTQSDPG